jgi:hypothetical protein
MPIEITIGTIPPNMDLKVAQEGKHPHLVVCGCRKVDYPLIPPTAHPTLMRDPFICSLI